ncbi:cobaltochelatase subunit CobN [Tissierella sp.]|uniref:cobaltochelatase subunit CobN n=1 Tax=Tissierella sp. TaxID=41274 RepID=UPI003062626D
MRETKNIIKKYEHFMAVNRLDKCKAKYHSPTYGKALNVMKDRRNMRNKVCNFNQSIYEELKQVHCLEVRVENLRRLDNSKKKIAIIFHNHLSGDSDIDNVYGFDSIESLVILLSKMKIEGYDVEYLPKDGKELIDRLLRYSTNKIELSIDGKKVLIPGVINGNIFIGIQYSKDLGDELLEEYYSSDKLGNDKCSQGIFKADAVIHVGSHDISELLLEKSGLCSGYYPNIVLGIISKSHYYVIKNEGDEVQFRGKSYISMIECMVPPLNFVGSYDDIEEVYNLLRMYYDAKLNGMKNLYLYKKMLWKEVCKLNIQDDIEYSKEHAFKDFDKFCEILSSYLNEIKFSYIKEGFHVLGRSLYGEDLVNMILVTMSSRNDSIPSLHEVICEVFGYDYEFMLNNKGMIVEGTSKTYGDLLGEVSTVAKKIIIHFYDFNFKTKYIDGVIQKYLGSTNDKMAAILRYIAEELVPKLHRAKDEIYNLMKLLNGQFVPAVKSENVFMGDVDTLPIGRNFYTLNSRIILSSLAWEKGKKLGDEVLKDYVINNGRYPKSIALVLCLDPTIRNREEDVAEILYLMGLRPVWNKKNCEVVDLEFISMEELGRPRIDVIVKISGSFRDTFQGIIDLLGKAFEKVSELEENENYIYQHVKADIEKEIKLGYREEDAKDNALLRIFGSKAGTYGTGIDKAIDIKRWNNGEDLSEIYLNSQGYSYGRGKNGKFEKEQLIEKLRRVDITVQNIISREIDILDSSDYYQYHGGLACAVKAISGKQPEMYYGDSSNPIDIKVRNIATELKYIYRIRVLNSNWIKSMKKHGYKSAGYIYNTISNSFGWDATSHIMENWMYEELAEKYMFSEDIKEWFEENNPMALYNIVEKLLDAYRRKMWDPKEGTLEKLVMYISKI